jgi:peptidylprolyl isomerase
LCPGAPVSSADVTTTSKRQRQREGRVARLEAERRAAIRAARRRRIIMAVVVAAIVVGFLAIIPLVGGDDGGGDEAAPSTPTTTAPDKPEVTIPETPPPTTLQTSDLTVGDGEEAQAGDTLRVHYVGKIYATGEEFDSSYEPREPGLLPEPIEIQLVSPGVIEGWAQGLVGVREGSRRQLVIPPDLGYGAEGQPPDIPANSTLVFVIDVLDVEKPPAPSGG